MIDKNALLALADEMCRRMTGGNGNPAPDPVYGAELLEWAERIRALAAQAPAADSEAVVFRFRDALCDWSEWLEIDELVYFGRDGNLVKGPHPEWEVEYAYTRSPAAPTPPAVDETTLRQALHAMKRCAQESGGRLWEPHIAALTAALAKQAAQESD